MNTFQLFIHFEPVFILEEIPFILSCQKTYCIYRTGGMVYILLWCIVLERCVELDWLYWTVCFIYWTDLLYVLDWYWTGVLYVLDWTGVLYVLGWCVDCTGLVCCMNWTGVLYVPN